MADPTAPEHCFQTIDALYEHWQGHRRLTRRLIEAYPEDQLFEFRLGGMRTFGQMVLEMIAMAAPMVEGLATLTYPTGRPDVPRTRAGLLERWDADTDAMDRDWPTIPPERFQETVTAFGQYTGPAHALVMYVIDNEIHHRGQGYAYARALGADVPAFPDRS